VFDKLGPVSKAFFAVALSPLTDCDFDARICKDLDRRFGDETGSEKEGFLGRIAQLGLDGCNKRSHIRSPGPGSLNRLLSTYSKNGNVSQLLQYFSNLNAQRKIAPWSRSRSWALRPAPLIIFTWCGGGQLRPLSPLVSHAFVLFLLPVPSTEYLEALVNPDLVFEVGHGNDHKVMHDL
jgi:hypothetical protein